MNILGLLDLTPEQKEKGVWLSGIEGEGEYKSWHTNGKLNHHSLLASKVAF
jgi:hypothetical protein